MADTGGEGANKLRPDPRQTMGAGSSPASVRLSAEMGRHGSLGRGGARKHRAPILLLYL